jgi:hypothetical protein
MLATADRSTVASTRLWLNVFTSRRLREIVCGPGLAGLQRVYCSDPSLKVALTAFLQGGLFITSAVLGEGLLGEAVTAGLLGLLRVALLGAVWMIGRMLGGMVGLVSGLSSVAPANTATLSASPARCDTSVWSR